MSVGDIKTRLRDVPGIENLSMEIQQGRCLLKWGHGSGSYQAVCDVTASDLEMMTAIRNAARLPSVALIPDAIPAAVAPAAQGTKPVSNPNDVLTSIDAKMADHAKQMDGLMQAGIATLESSLQRQRASFAMGIKGFADRVDQTTDGFDALMSRYSNSFGA